MELRRPGLWIGVAIAAFVAWAGTHLEILHFDDRPERAWGLVLSTVETAALLLVLAARLRGADLTGARGSDDALRATSLGAAGLSGAETVGAATAAWLAAVGAASLVVVLRNDMGPPLGGAAAWALFLGVELVLVAAWLTLAVTWLGRLPGLALTLGVICLGRAGVGGIAASLWPAPAPAPPDAPAWGALGAGLAVIVALVALATASRSATRVFD